MGKRLRLTLDQKINQAENLKASLEVAFEEGGTTVYLFLRVDEQLQRVVRFDQALAMSDLVPKKIPITKILNCEGGYDSSQVRRNLEEEVADALEGQATVRVSLSAIPNGGNGIAFTLLVNGLYRYGYASFEQVKDLVWEVW